MTIAFDFDNVIHKYRQGWRDGEIYDELDEGMLHLIDYLLGQGHYVFIMSTRSRFQIKRYFDYLTDTEGLGYDYRALPFVYETFGFWSKFWKKKHVLGITNRKAVFDVLIDDRAINFNPLKGIDADSILNFRPVKYK